MTQEENEKLVKENKKLLKENKMLKKRVKEASEEMERLREEMEEVRNTNTVNNNFHNTINLRVDIDKDCNITFEEMIKAVDEHVKMKLENEGQQGMLEGM